MCQHRLRKRFRGCDLKLLYPLPVEYYHNKQNFVENTHKTFHNKITFALTGVEIIYSVKCMQYSIQLG